MAKLRRKEERDGTTNDEESRKKDEERSKKGQRFTNRNPALAHRSTPNASG
jgi:hypothetical protein